jgi:hypothetical protein
MFTSGVLSLLGGTPSAPPPDMLENVRLARKGDAAAAHTAGVVAKAKVRFACLARPGQASREVVMLVVVASAATEPSLVSARLCIRPGKVCV